MLGTYQSKEGLHKSTRWNVKPMHKTYASLDSPHERIYGRGMVT